MYFCEGFTFYFFLKWQTHSVSTWDKNKQKKSPEFSFFFAAELFNIVHLQKKKIN